MLARTLPQQTPVIFKGKAAVLRRNQRIVQRNVITCSSSDFEISLADKEFRSLQRTRDRQNSWIHVRTIVGDWAVLSHDKTLLPAGRSLLPNIRSSFPATEFAGQQH